VKVKSVAPSHVTNYKFCPRRYRYKELDLPKIVTDTYRRDLGKDIHFAIRDYFNEISDKPSEKEIEEKAKESFEIYKIPKRFLNKFLEFELIRLKEWKSYKPTMVETALTLEIWKDLPPINGVIDFYSKPDRTLIDWKTGSIDHTIDVIQGKIYELLLEKQGFPVDRVLFVNLRTGLVQQLPRITEGFIEKEIKTFIEAVELGYFPKRRGVWCENCEYLLRCELEGECFWGW